MSKPWMLTERELALPVRLVWLLNILVLEGCSSSPRGLAERTMSSSIVVRSGRVWLLRHTSSAKRR